jgi:hypothetical protein
MSIRFVVNGKSYDMSAMVVTRIQQNLPDDVFLKGLIETAMSHSGDVILDGLANIIDGTDQDFETILVEAVRYALDPQGYCLPSFVHLDPQARLMICKGLDYLGIDTNTLKTMQEIQETMRTDRASANEALSHAYFTSFLNKYHKELFNDALNELDTLEEVDFKEFIRNEKIQYLLRDWVAGGTDINRILEAIKAFPSPWQGLDYALFMKRMAS